MYIEFRSIKLWIMIVWILVIGSLLSCDVLNDNEPEIIGCNTFEYQGNTIRATCEYGVKSYDYETSEAPGVSFHIECSGGCLESVTVIP